MGDTLSLQSIGKLGAAQAVTNLSASARAASESDPKDSFGNVLNRTAEKTDTDTLQKNSTIGSGKSGNESREDIRSSASGRVKTQKDDPKEVKDAEGTKDTVRGAAETVMEKVEEELNVSEEEVISAMETLGLGFADLLKPENIGALTAEIMEIDISEVVTNEELYSSVQDIIGVQREVTGDLLQELNMTAEEFKAAIDAGTFEKTEPEEALTVKPEAPAAEAEEPVRADITADDKAAVKTEVPEKAEQEEALKETVRPEGSEETRIDTDQKETITSKEETAGTPAETVRSSEVVREPDRQPEDGSEEVVKEKLPEKVKEAEIPTDEGEKEDDAPKDQYRREEGGSVKGQVSQTAHSTVVIQPETTNRDFMDDVIRSTSETTSEFTNSSERIRDIVNQVRDQIRIQVSEQTTTMEMQLNPESLGKVGLHIESKAGNVTAQFIAQDESVRAALETQVAELKRNLEEQGIKIESVEVTLASREFESDFLNQGNNGNADTPDREEAERTARLRRINLGAEADIPEEEMTEEEALNRKIMTENGGTVDFTA